MRCAMLAAVLAAMAATSSGVGYFRETTVNAALELISVNNARAVDPAKLNQHLASQIRGVRPSDVIVRMKKEAPISIKATGRVSISVEVKGSAGTGWAITEALANFMSERPVQGLLPSGDPDSALRMFSRPFLATIGTENNFPLPFVLRLVRSDEVVHACEELDCARGYTCAEGEHVFQLDYECCPRCEVSPTQRFREEISQLILDHAAGDRTAKVQVEVQIQLIAINDAVGVEGGSLALHISEQVVGIQDHNIVISALSNTNPGAQVRQDVTVVIEAPAGTGTAVVSAIAAYMSSRAETPTVDGEVNSKRERFSAPFLLPGSNALPYPFVMKLQSAKRVWDTEAACAGERYVKNPCRILKCNADEEEFLPDLECCAVCQSTADHWHRWGLAKFALEQEAGRPGPMAAVQGDLQLIPINDVPTIYLNKLIPHIMKATGATRETIALEPETYTNVKAHQRLDFTLFIRGPENTIPILQKALAKYMDQVIQMGDLVSKPFLANLGEPADLLAPYVVLRRNLLRLPLAYCMAHEGCPKTLKCGKGETLFRLDQDCCDSCVPNKQKAYLDELGKYLLEKQHWDEDKDVYDQDMDAYKGDLAQYESDVAECATQQGITLKEKNCTETEGGEGAEATQDDDAGAATPGGPTTTSTTSTATTITTTTKYVHVDSYGDDGDDDDGSRQ